MPSVTTANSLPVKRHEPVPPRVLAERLERAGSRLGYLEFTRLLESSYRDPQLYLEATRLLARYLEPFKATIRIGSWSYELFKRIHDSPGDLPVDRVVDSESPVVDGFAPDSFFGVVVRRNGSVELLAGEPGWLQGSPHDGASSGEPAFARLILGDSRAYGVVGDSPLIPLGFIMERVGPSGEAELSIDFSRSDTTWYWALWPSLKGRVERGSALGSIAGKVRELLDYQMETVEGVPGVALAGDKLLVGLTPLECSCGNNTPVIAGFDALLYMTRLFKEFTLATRGDYIVETVIHPRSARVTVTDTATGFKLEFAGTPAHGEPASPSVGGGISAYFTRSITHVRVPETGLSLDMWSLKPSKFILAGLPGRLGALVGVNELATRLGILFFPLKDQESEELLEGHAVVYPSCSGLEREWYCLEPGYTSTVGGLLPVYKDAVVPVKSGRQDIPGLLERIVKKISAETIAVASGRMISEGDRTMRTRIAGGELIVEKRGQVLEVVYNSSEPIWQGRRILVRHYSHQEAWYTVGVIRGYHRVKYIDPDRPEYPLVYYPVVLLSSGNTVLAVLDTYAVGVHPSMLKHLRPSTR